MPIDKWKAGKDTYQIVDHLVATKFPHLALIHDSVDSGHESQILIIFREKAGKASGRLTLGTTKKAPQILHVVTGHEYKYVIELAGDVWLNELNDKEREALLFRQLCACAVEEDPESGEIKCGIAAPDVQYYYSELDAYGDWMPRLDEEEDEKQGAVSGARDPDVLEQMMGVGRGMDHSQSDEEEEVEEEEFELAEMIA